MLHLLFLGCVIKSELPPPPSDTPAVDTESTPTEDTTAPLDSEETASESQDSETLSDSDTEDTAPTLPGLDPLPRNVLVISLDTVRRDWFSRFGGPAETPNLDALMDAGLVLSNHRSCSNWTWTSMVCAQASRSESELGWIADGSNASQLPPVDTVMADGVLRDLGFHTRVVSSNPFFSSSAGTTLQFEEATYLNAADATQVNEAALPGLEALVGLDGEQPWYFHVHYFDPHVPYSPPSEYLSGLEGLEEIPYNLDRDETYAPLSDDFARLTEEEQTLVVEHLRVRYSGEMAFVDDKVGELLDHAESLGLLDDTLIVFFTDHGEQIFEHGTLGHDEGLYEMENRAAASFVAPGLPPIVWTGPTMHQDIWPTALTLMGQTLPEEFLGVEVGGPVADRVRLADRYSTKGDGHQMLQMAEYGGVKLIYNWDGSKELYRLDTDPDELNNVYTATDSDVVMLWEALLPEVKALDPLVSESPVDPGP